MKKILLCAVMLAALCTSLAFRSTKEGSKACEFENSIYYWRTTFTLNPFEQEFLKKHHIRRLYIRMFDVATHFNFINRQTEIVPIATTRFIDSIPGNVSIIPTVYITLEALRKMTGKEAETARLIVRRLQAMASYNHCGQIHEVQFDCDWTSSTQPIYNLLCTEARQLLHNDSISLSATIRLHQLSSEAPPVDRGVLMLYNTGALKNPQTRNSILDINDVKPYLKKRRYPLPLDYAYPAFGWGVKFRNKHFQAIVTHPDSLTPGPGETIRPERPSINEVLTVKKAVETVLGRPANGNILYHLDSSQLTHYTENEINQIYTVH